MTTGIGHAHVMNNRFLANAAEWIYYFADSALRRIAAGQDRSASG